MQPPKTSLLSSKNAYNFFLVTETCTGTGAAIFLYAYLQDSKTIIEIISRRWRPSRETILSKTRFSLLAFIFSYRRKFELAVKKSIQIQNYREIPRNAMRTRTSFNHNALS